MPAGDAHRVWFPEMVGRLRSEWNPAMPFPRLVALSNNLDQMLQQIRFERHIQPPIVRCSKCGSVGRAAEPRVSVRAVILATARFRVAERAATKKFEKDWAKYRTQNGLDLYGKVVAAQAATAPPFDKPRCTHGTEEA